MRHFLLAKNVAYPTETELNKVAGGAVGFYYNNNGVLAVDATGANIKTAKEALNESAMTLGAKVYEEAAKAAQANTENTENEDNVKEAEYEEK